LYFCCPIPRGETVAYSDDILATAVVKSFLSFAKKEKKNVTG
jgi:hypothetical protein